MCRYTAKNNTQRTSDVLQDAKGSFFYRYEKKLTGDHCACHGS